MKFQSLVLLFRYAALIVVFLVAGCINLAGDETAPKRKPTIKITSTINAATESSQPDRLGSPIPPAAPISPTAPQFLPPELETIEPDKVDRLELIAQLEVPYVYWAHFSPDGSRLATVSQRPVERDWYITVWDMKSGKALYEVVGGPTIAFALDSTALATFIRQDGIRVWDLESGALLRSIEMPGATAISPDWRTIVSISKHNTTSDTSTVDLVDLATGLANATFEVGGTVVDARFAPDGRLLAVTTGGIMSETTLWDVDAKASPITLEEVDRLLFSSSGKLLAGLFGPDRRIYLLDINDFTIYRELENSQGPQPGWLAISAEDLLLGAALGNGVRLWDIDSAEELITINQQASYVTFSPDNQIMVALDFAGVVTFWGIPSN